jgi:hypothetical protein
MRYFLQFILYSDLQLQYSICIFRVLDLLSHFLSFSIQACLIERLGMIELVGVNFWVEFGKLVIHISGLGVVLDVVVAMP